MKSYLISFSLLLLSVFYFTACDSTDKSAVKGESEATGTQGETTPTNAPETQDFYKAARMGDEAAVKSLLEAGVDPDVPDKDGETPLLLAAYFGRTEVVRLLLDSGAEIDMADAFGRTPLMRASQLGRGEVVQLLLGASADLTIKDGKGITALMYAADVSGDEEVFRYILEAGADVDARDNAGRTALMWAAKEGLVEAVQILLDAGADPEASDTKGATALGLSEASARAEKRGAQEVTDMLRNAIEERGAGSSAK